MKNNKKQDRFLRKTAPSYVLSFKHKFRHPQMKEKQSLNLRQQSALIREAFHSTATEAVVYRYIDLSELVDNENKQLLVMGLRNQLLHFAVLPSALPSDEAETECCIPPQTQSSHFLRRMSRHQWVQFCVCFLIIRQF